MSGTSVILLRCPFPDTSSAARVAEAALEARLAAAATRTDGASHYRWQGALHAHGESVLTLTTTAARLDALCALIVQLHPYELPALTWSDRGCTPETAAWAEAETAP